MPPRRATINLVVTSGPDVISSDRASFDEATEMLRLVGEFLRERARTSRGEAPTPEVGEITYREGGDLAPRGGGRGEVPTTRLVSDALDVR